MEADAWNMKVKAFIITLAYQDLPLMLWVSPNSIVKSIQASHSKKNIFGCCNYRYRHGL